MRPVHGIFIAVVLLTSSSFLRAEDAVKNYILELDHEDFTRRELASRHLRLMGERVLPDLQNAFLKSQSIESQVRIQSVMKNIENDVEDAKVKDRRKRAIVQVYPIRDLLQLGDIKSPTLNFGYGSLTITNSFEEHRDGENLAALIKAAIEPHSWEFEGFTVNVFRDSLIVCQAAETQAQIAALLKAMRAETQPSITVKCVQLQSAGPITETLLSASSMDDLVKIAAVKPMTWQFLTRNLRRAVILDGKQIEYINENRITSSEGGNVFAGAYSSQCLSGVSITVLPKLKAERGEIQVELNFNRNDNLVMRDVSALEKWLFDNTQPKGNPEKVKGVLPETAKVEPAFTPLLPSADLQILNTEVTIPSGMWVNAGRIAGKNGAQDTYIFLHAELVPLPPLAK